LQNRPQIHGVTLQGNRTAADLGLASAADLQDEAAARQQTITQAVAQEATARGVAISLAVGLEANARNTQITDAINNEAQARQSQVDELRGEIQAADAQATLATDAIWGTPTNPKGIISGAYGTGRVDDLEGNVANIDALAQAHEDFLFGDTAPIPSNFMGYITPVTPALFPEQLDPSITPELQIGDRAWRLPLANIPPTTFPLDSSLYRHYVRTAAVWVQQPAGTFYAPAVGDVWKMWSTAQNRFINNWWNGTQFIEGDLPVEVAGWVKLIETALTGSYLKTVEADTTGTLVNLIIGKRDPLTGENTTDIIQLPLPSNLTDLIPTQANAGNKLVDLNLMQSSIQSALTSIPAGLKPPIEIDLESELPPESGLADVDVGTFYIIQDMDVSMQGRTGKAWANHQDGNSSNPVIWYRVYDQYYSADGTTITLTPTGQLQVDQALIQRIQDNESAIEALETAVQNLEENKAPANISLNAETGTSANNATGAVASTSVGAVAQIIWNKIRQVVNWVAGSFVNLTGNQTISGSKTFTAWQNFNSGIGNSGSYSQSGNTFYVGFPQVSIGGNGAWFQGNGKLYYQPDNPIDNDDEVVNKKYVDRIDSFLFGGTIGNFRGYWSNGMIIGNFNDGDGLFISQYLPTESASIQAAYSWWGGMWNPQLILKPFWFHGDMIDFGGDIYYYNEETGLFQTDPIGDYGYGFVNQVEMNLHPEAWPENEEVDLGNGLFGRRLVGTRTEPANESVDLYIAEEGVIASVVSVEGWWEPQAHGTSRKMRFGEVSGGTRSQLDDYSPVGNVALYLVSSFPTLNSQYEFWVRYTKL
jgi:hypothetical protein